MSTLSIIELQTLRNLELEKGSLADIGSYENLRALFAVSQIEEEIKRIKEIEMVGLIFKQGLSDKGKGPGACENSATPLSNSPLLAHVIPKSVSPNTPRGECVQKDSPKGRRPHVTVYIDSPLDVDPLVDKIKEDLTIRGHKG